MGDTKLDKDVLTELILRVASAAATDWSRIDGQCELRVIASVEVYTGAHPITNTFLFSFQTPDALTAAYSQATRSFVPHTYLI